MTPYLIPYAAAWLLSSLLFTRHFFTHYEYSCPSGCDRSPNYRSQPTIHADNCRNGEKEWKHEPLPPGEAMFMALLWPLVLLYMIMLWNHLRAPFALRDRKRRRMLTDAELKRLDEILYSDQKEPS